MHFCTDVNKAIADIEACNGDHIIHNVVDNAAQYLSPCGSRQTEHLLRSLIHTN